MGTTGAERRTFFHKHYDCLDCHEQWPGDYVVSDELWSKAGMTPYGGRLCFICLEKRLGRALTILDFPPGIAANKPIHFAYSLAEAPPEGDDNGR